MVTIANPKSRQRGRPRDPTLTDEERRAHRRLRPKRNAQDQQPEHLVTVTLKLAHGRNGQWIGPGEVKVPHSLAHELRYAEEQQAYQTRKLQDFWPGDINREP